MRRAIKETNKTIRIPTASLNKIIKIKRLEKKVARELGRRPTNSELAKYCDFSSATIGRLRDVQTNTLSLEDTIGDEDEGSIYDVTEETGAKDSRGQGA